MRTRWRLAAVLGATLLLATGCAPHDAVTPTPKPSATPVFATDEEALAAAQKAYAEYLAVSDAITADGGTNVERIDPYVDESFRQGVYDSFKKFVDRGLHTRGASTTHGMRLQQSSLGAAGGDLSFYVCVDVTQVRVLDSTDADVTPSSRQNVVPLAITYTAIAKPLALKLKGSETWTGENFCNG